MTLDTHRQSLAACRRCTDAGYFIGSTPIFTLNAGATFMTVGQAPGRHEAEVSHQPFSGPAGRRLFRWLAQAGFDEAEFRATQAMMAVTLCYPGPHPAGRGDRVPTRAEQALCAPWLEAALALVQPKVLIPIGALAIARFLGNERASVSGIEASAGLSGQREQPANPEGGWRTASIPEVRSFIGDAPQPALRGQPPQDDTARSLTMTDLIGHCFERDGRVVVPLPHPSGASQWFNVPENKVQLARALEILAELRLDFLPSGMIL